jgi:hypothetical protein
MSSPIPAIYKSIVRSISDVIEVINAKSLYPEAIGYHNWEERTPETELPASTLIGTDGFGFDENEGRWLIRFALAISSYRDVNLLTEVELLGLLHDRYGEGKKIDLLSLSDGAIASELLVSQFKVQPMAQSEQRNYRVIGIELLRTGI